MQRSKPLTLTRDQCRAVDRYAIEELRIPGVVLMENAGRNAAELILKWLRPTPTKSLVSILCGKGNNGGDGLVIARHLAREKIPVAIDVTDDPATLTGDAGINYAIVEKMGLPIARLDAARLDAAAARWRKSDVIVDALLGTGFAGTVREPLHGIIERINALREPRRTRPPKASGVRSVRASEHRPLIVAVDVPSGLDCDTGRPGGTAVRADRTITFLARKTGYAYPAAKPFMGRLSVVDIGAPLELILQRL